MTDHRGRLLMIHQFCPVFPSGKFDMLATTDTSGQTVHSRIPATRYIERIIGTGPFLGLRSAIGKTPQSCMSHRMHQKKLTESTWMSPHACESFGPPIPIRRWKRRQRLLTAPRWIRQSGFAVRYQACRILSWNLQRLAIRSQCKASGSAWFPLPDLSSCSCCYPGARHFDR